LADIVAKVGEDQFARNNRIETGGFLNQGCVLMPDLESMFACSDVQNRFATESAVNALSPQCTNSGAIGDTPDVANSSCACRSDANDPNVWTRRALQQKS
jgi:hypothetical protein